MNSNKGVTKELLDLKAKVMIQKIDKLYLICNMLFNNSKTSELESIKVVKEQYLKRYNRLIQTGQYEGYKEVEDITIKEIAKIELSRDQYIYNTIQRYDEIIGRNIELIYQSQNYQNYSDLERELQQIETIKQVFKLYIPYIRKSEMEIWNKHISSLKFDALWRSQVEQLIYGNVEKQSTLMKYDNQEERKFFIEQLEEKIKSLTIQGRDAINDEILKVEPDIILKHYRLLERLIIIDMERKPDDYRNLVNAKIFNAHLCNIANNPFEQEIYLTEEELHGLGYLEYGRCNFRKGDKEALKANKVNYSLLRAVLRSIITDEDISIIECENLYKKFGFKCRPILVNDGQKCVQSIYKKVKDEKEYKGKTEIEKSKEGKYCKIHFDGLVYNFDKDSIGQNLDDVHEYENNVIDLLNKRSVKKHQKEKKIKFYIKEKVKEEGIVTKDIEVMILLLQDRINDYNGEIKELEKLQQIENQNGKLTLEETKKLLLIINDIYRQLDIKYNVWDLLPLEGMGSENSNRVYLAPIPEESGTKRVEVGHSILSGYQYEDRYYYKSDLQPLWKKYQRDCKDLSIEVRKYGRNYESSPQFEICIKLDDISDLPIDYKKVEILTERELQEIMEREEGNGR